jgi:hypothetical protein
VRTSGNRQHTTVPEHMPDSHRRYAGWTPGEIRRQAERIGPSTGALVDLILKTKTRPEQGFRACLGIARLARPGLPTPSGTRRAGTANPSSTTACRGSSPSSSRPMATAAFPGSPDSS